MKGKPHKITKRYHFHSSTNRGKRVRVVTRKGDVIRGKFFDSSHKEVWLDAPEGRIKISKGNIASFQIDKDRTPEFKNT